MNDVDGKRKCRICGEVKPLLTDYYVLIKGKRRSSYCKKCDIERSRIRHKKNYDKVREKVKYLKLKAKGIITRKEAVRRARQMNAEGTHTVDEWEDLKKKYEYFCLACGKKEPEIKLTRDHIIPLSRGGTDYISNIQPLCNSCNAGKFTKNTNYILLSETIKSKYL